MGRAAKVLKVIVVATYPLGVYYGLKLQNTRLVALIILAAVIPTVLSAVRRQKREHLWVILRVPLTVLATVTAAFALDDPRFILALPVIISAELLVAFGTSLMKPVSMIERFARMVEPDLSEEKVIYCRKVTVVWCAFFVANGATAGALAVYGPLAWWTLYTGLIAYVLMGVLFGTEYLIRWVRFREPSPQTGER